DSGFNLAGQRDSLSWSRATWRPARLARRHLTLAGPRTQLAAAGAHQRARRMRRRLAARVKVRQQLTYHNRMMRAQLFRLMSESSALRVSTTRRLNSQTRL